VTEAEKDARAERQSRGGRPAFAESFPRDPELDALVNAFEAGDFGRVRAGAKQLAASAKDEGVKRAAEAVLARTKADPLQTLLVVISAVLLVLLSAWWIGHGGKE
jgi:hypothetical protein